MCGCVWVCVSASEYVWVLVNMYVRECEYVNVRDSVYVWVCVGVCVGVRVIRQGHLTPDSVLNEWSQDGDTSTLKTQKAPYPNPKHNTDVPL